MKTTLYYLAYQAKPRPDDVHTLERHYPVLSYPHVEMSVDSVAGFAKDFLAITRSAWWHWCLRRPIKAGDIFTYADTHCLFITQEQLQHYDTETTHSLFPWIHLHVAQFETTKGLSHARY